jgi:hypothetical protein
MTKSIKNIPAEYLNDIKEDTFCQFVLKYFAERVDTMGAFKFLVEGSRAKPQPLSLHMGFEGRNQCL